MVSYTRLTFPTNRKRVSMAQHGTQRHHVWNEIVPMEKCIMGSHGVPWEWGSRAEAAGNYIGSAH